MRQSFFDTPIEFIKGVGPKRAELFNKELNVFTASDLLHHYPFRYVDRSRFYSIKELNPEMHYVQLKGKVKNISLQGQGRQQRLTAEFSDGAGVMDLAWFQGVKYFKTWLQEGVEYVLFGKPGIFNRKLQMVHPDMELFSDFNAGPAQGYQPVYSSTEKMKPFGLDSKGIYKIIKQILSQMPDQMPETLSVNIKENYKLIDRIKAINLIHTPDTTDDIRNATYRLKFDELFYIQLRLLKSKQSRTEKLNGHIFSIVGDQFNNFYHSHLPFQLTEAQKKVVREIRTDMGSGFQMNRLLQGDVGSGKTIVALLCMLIAIDNNTQACLMAPTEILAMQHLESISALLTGLDLRVELLTGNIKGKERKRILEAATTGEVDILIGTHALIEGSVQYKDLGLVIIDEQHRFGVEQRAKMWEKNQKPPHVLVMTATPIPRTLAMTLYGDLDVSIINELPPGRKPILTLHRYDNKRFELFQFLKKEIALGRQIYIVYPLIQESEKLDLKNLMEGFDIISEAFPKPQYQVSIVHGKMKPAEREFEMNRFVRGETHIMVATTVIEVGVNVPNASVMIIENAERFGLSQLHQLRGRVGRGADQSYCVLMTSHKLSHEGKVRIETMVKTTDGFEIAEVDLKLRGPGDLMGTQQSGDIGLHLADLGKDAKILELARQAATELLDTDPAMISSSNNMITKRFESLHSDSRNWSKIS